MSKHTVCEFKMFLKFYNGLGVCLSDSDKESRLEFRVEGN